MVPPAHLLLNNGRRRQGFSLMEVLLALVVVTFGLYGILDLTTSNQRLAWRAECRAVAIELARAKMAELQAAGFERAETLVKAAGDRSAQPYRHFPPAPAAFESPYTAPDFLWRARLDPVPDNPDAINIEIRVYWQTKGGLETDTAQANSVSVGGFLVRK